jgi:hypothetical protein
MSEIIKNRPKTTKEALNELIEPVIPGTKDSIDSNRGNDVSVKGDIVKDISIGFENITEAVIYYFDHIIKPSVIEDGTRIKVPVMVADPERWKSAQKDGFLRDKDGRAMYPLITLKRESVEKRRDIGNKLDGNQVHLYQTYQVGYSRKNQYDNLSVLTNRIPVKEYRNIIVPDYYTITYTCTVYVNYLEDLDKILESIGYASYSYWGDSERFQFMAMVDDLPTTQQIIQGEDRIVSSTFTIKLNGHVIPDSINRDISSTNKFLSKAQVIFTMESETSNLLSTSTDSIYKTANSAKGSNYAPSIKIMDIATYLNSNKEKTATSMTNTTALFIGEFMKAPSGLPLTSVDNFSFFANSNYIEKSAIVSFTDNGNNTCTLVIDPNLLGYTLSNEDEILAIGKFK